MGFDLALSHKVAANSILNTSSSILFVCFLPTQKVENKLMFETQPVSGFYNKLEVNKMFDGSASATLQGYLAQKKSPPRRNLQ